MTGIGCQGGVEQGEGRDEEVEDSGWVEWMDGGYLARIVGIIVIRWFCKNCSCSFFLVEKF